MSASSEKKLRQAAREAGTDKKALRAEAEAKAKAQSKRRWTLGTVAIVLLIAAILLLNSGLVYKLTAYTVNGEAYSAARMNYRFGMQYNNFLTQYGSYASMFGLDTSAGVKGLDEQDCTMIDGTWRDYFLSAAETDALQTKLLCDYAAENGIALTEEELADVEAGFEGVDEAAKAQGYANADRLLSAMYGEGVNLKLALEEARVSALANKAVNTLFESFQYTDSELKEKYDSYEGSQDLYDYIYYYVAADTVETNGEDGATKNEVTPETLAAAKQKAEDIAAGYKASEGEDFEARMNEAVAAVVEDASAYTQTGVKGANLGDYKQWLTDASRKAGDITVVESSSGTGYYVVVFVSHSDNNYNLAQVRHILIKAAADANGEYTEEAKNTAKAMAESILDEFNAGDKSEESFAALAEKYSEDAGSNTNGGLYDSIYKGQTVPEFDSFCFAPHKHGDVAIVYNESASYTGYHIIYYVGEGQNYRDYIAENDLRNAAVSDWLTAQTDAAVTSEGFGMKFVA